MTDAITAPSNNVELEPNDNAIIEAEIHFGSDLEESREVENEYFVLGYNQ